MLAEERRGACPTCAQFQGCNEIQIAPSISPLILPYYMEFYLLKSLFYAQTLFSRGLGLQIQSDNSGSINGSSSNNKKSNNHNMLIHHMPGFWKSSPKLLSPTFSHLLLRHPSQLMTSLRISVGKQKQLEQKHCMLPPQHLSTQLHLCNHCVCVLSPGKD